MNPEAMIQVPETCLGWWIFAGLLVLAIFAIQRLGGYLEQREQRREENWEYHCEVTRPQLATAFQLRTRQEGQGDTTVQ